MAKSTLSSNSLKEYLKRYESNNEEDKKRKKKKKRSTTVMKSNALGVFVVDEDPVWQKPINVEEENADDPTDEEKPQVDEDIEVKRMRRLEELKAKRAYNSISEDGSGWVSLSPKHASFTIGNSDVSLPRETRARNDTPSPSNELKPSVSGELDEKPTSCSYPSSDSSPPRKPKVWKDTSSQGADLGRLDYVQEDIDLSPPRQRRKRHHTPSPEADANPARFVAPNSDISPPRRSDRRASKAGLRGNYKATELSDLSPPRRKISVSVDDSHHGSDLSPPRKWRKDVRRDESPEFSAPHSQKHIVADASPRTKQKAPPVLVSFKQKKVGLLSRQEFGEDISETKKEDWMRFRERNPSVSSNVEPIFRDKIKGDRISKEEFLKSRGKIEEKPKEIKVEWGKGLAQKRESEAKVLELELEKDRPFARTRDDAELDNMLKDRVRWGDPMAHLVKKRHSELVLPDLGDNERMRESGFVIPQDIPTHSWLKRGLDAAPNRYGIRPGRHWDGVDRSNGFEKQLFKRLNEKQATEREAYLWSVSDM